MTGSDEAPTAGDPDTDEAADETGPPVYWPTLTGEEAEQEWQALREWVERLLARFPHATRLPPCWWRHNDIVELCSALRDHERACYAQVAPATAAVEWHRAFRDIESRAEMWIRRFTCTVPGRGHADTAGPDPDGGWDAFVAADVTARRPDREPETGSCS